MAAMFCGAACGEKAGESLYPTDTIVTDTGSHLKITFFAHASIAFEYEGRHIYIDPVSDFADYASLPRADLILVGHEHSDHFDLAAIDSLSILSTIVAGNGMVIDSLRTAIDAPMYGNAMAHGDKLSLPTANGVIEIEAVPAYNTSPDQLKFHPRERLGNGYILNFGDTRVYVAGDTEDIPEMLALKDIEVAFLPVNQPYTMKEEQAARAVKAIRPAIFYPYHYGGTDHKTDLEKLARLIEGSGVEMRIRPLE